MIASFRHCGLKATYEGISSRTQFAGAGQWVDGCNRQIKAGPASCNDRGAGQPSTAETWPGMQRPMTNGRPMAPAATRPSTQALACEATLHVSP